MALGDNGKVLLKKKFTQKQLIAFTANMQTCLIGMEACSGSAQYPGAPFVANDEINLVLAKNIVSYFNALQQTLIPQ